MSRHRTSAGSKALKSRARKPARVKPQAVASQRHEGTRPAKAGTAPREGQTPEGQTLDVAAGRNKPARPVAEQTVEGVRNAEDGPKLGAGIPRACVDAAG